MIPPPSLERMSNAYNMDYVIAVGDAIKAATSRYLKTDDKETINRYILQLMENYQRKRKAR